MPAPPLPIECMQFILEHVDDALSLHSLLLTSKAWFPLVAERLYHDPFTRIHRCKNTPHALSLFLSRVVLCCSPSKDPAVAKLRHHFMTEISASTVATGLRKETNPPSIGYLSLVKIIRFSPRVLNAVAELIELLPKKLESQGLRLEKRDIYIMAGKPLSNTACVEYEPIFRRHINMDDSLLQYGFSDIKLQRSVLQALSNLECIIFDVGFSVIYQYKLLNTYNFVREYMSIHGVRRSRFDILYVGGRYWHGKEPPFHFTHRTYSLLQPHYTPKYITDCNGGGRLIDSLECVQSIQLTHICDQAVVREVMARLEECRSLKELWVTIDTRGTREIYNPWLNMPNLVRLDLGGLRAC